MEALLVYWLKANVVLALFAATYYGLLRRLTFFQLNRSYLLFALLFAAVYPLLPMPALLPADATALHLTSTATGLPATDATGAAPAAHGLGWYLLRAAGTGYLAGAAGLLLRLLGQLLSLARLRRRAQLARVLGQVVRVVPGAGSPFSFGRAIYFPESALTDAAHLPAALRHEQAHMRQGHTLDVLLWQVATALAWPSPAAWLLRRAALDNLEYLADAATVQAASLSRRAYQYLLLHQQAGAVPAPALAFHFSFLTLKNRIAMLNQPHSTSRQLGRYLLAAPLVVALALGYSGARAQTAPARSGGGPAPLGNLTATSPGLQHVVYFIDGQRTELTSISSLDPNTIASIEVKKDRATVQRYANDPAAEGIIFITTKGKAGSPAAQALADQANLSEAYTYKRVEVNALVPKALAYVTSHYPNARLSGEVMEVKKKATGQTRYDVQLVEGRRPLVVSFTPEGDFLQEQR